MPRKKKTTNILFWRLQQMQKNGSNLGDRAISDAMFESLAKEIPNYKFFVFSRNQEFLPMDYNLEGINIFSLKGFFKTFQILWTADVLILGGGTIIQNKSSGAVILFNFSLPLLALLLQKKLACYAIGIGGSKELSAWGRWLTRLILNHCCMITLRDEESFQMLQTIGVTKPFQVTADAAFTLNPAGHSETMTLLQKTSLNIEDSRPIIAVSLRRVFHRKGGILPVSLKIKWGLMREWETKIDSFKNEIALVLDEIITRHNAQLLFIPMYTGKSFFSPRDDLFTEDVILRMKTKDQTVLIKDRLTPAQFKGIMAFTDLLIGVPFHSLLIASSMGIPVVSLSYADKNVRFMKILELDEFSIDLRDATQTLDQSKLLELVNTALRDKEILAQHIRQKIEPLKTKCSQNTQIFKKVIEKNLNEKNNE